MRSAEGRSGLDLAVLHQASISVSSLTEPVLYSACPALMWRPKAPEGALRASQKCLLRCLVHEAPQLTTGLPPV